VDHVVTCNVRGGAREGGVIVDVVIAGAGPRLVLVHGSPLHRPLWWPVHGIVGYGSLLARSVGEVGGLEIQSAHVGVYRHAIPLVVGVGSARDARRAGLLAR